MQTPDYDFWLANKDCLEHMVTQLVGFPVEIYWGASGVTGVGRSDSYQIMPSIEAEDSRSVFWGWHLDTNPHWFPTPLEAAAAFVKAWREWLTEAGGQS